MPQLFSLSFWPLDWSLSTLSVFGVGYLLLVRLLRWKRYDAVHRKFAGRLHDLTAVEAQEIVTLSQNWDMPSIDGLASAVAFMKTLAIPSTSKLLARTGEIVMLSLHRDDWPTLRSCLASPDDPSSNAQLDPRAFISIARVNWLHRKYDISNDDYLYTLCAFALTLPQSAERYGWRSLSPLECQARFILWREIGTLMGIQDIPETIEELDAWMKAFEKIHMVPAESSHQCAEATLAESTYGVTSLFGLKTLVRHISISMLDERTRIALMLPEPPRAARVLLEVVLRVAASVQRNLLLPRRAYSGLIPWETRAVASEPIPRQYPNEYQAKPWYKPEPNGISAMIQNGTAALGLISPDDMPGPGYKSEGYLIQEMGPPRYEKSGHEEVIREAEEMMGCPLGHGGAGLTRRAE